MDRSRIAQVLDTITSSPDVMPGAVRTALREAFAREHSPVEMPAQPEVVAAPEGGARAAEAARVWLTRLLEALPLLRARRYEQAEALVELLENMEKGQGGGLGFQAATLMQSLRREPEPVRDGDIELAVRLPELDAADQGLLTARLAEAAESGDPTAKALVGLLFTAADLLTEEEDDEPEDEDVDESAEQAEAGAEPEAAPDTSVSTG